jgi:hypothetical protein
VLAAESPPDDVAIFRKFAQRATKNSHNALKTCWTILFTGGTFALLHSFDDLIDCKLYLDYKAAAELADNSHCGDIYSSASYFWLSALLLFVYVLTFYRFYVGNIRVFDMIYDEVFEFVASLHEKEVQDAKDNKKGVAGDASLRELREMHDREYQRLLTYSDSLMKWESIYLIMTVLMIVYLTVGPLFPLKFLIVYFALLVADIVWSADYLWSVADIAWRRVGAVATRLGWWATPADYDKVPNAKQARAYFKDRVFEMFPKLENTGFERMFPSYAMRVWHYNNLWCLYYLGLFLGCYLLVDCALKAPVDRAGVQLSILWCAAIAAVVNCVVDLWLTQDFYHPKFSKSHRTLIGPPTAQP